MKAGLLNRGMLRTTLGLALLFSPTTWAVFPGPVSDPSRDRQIRELEDQISREESDLSRLDDQIRSVDSEARSRNQEAERLRRDSENVERQLRDVANRLQDAQRRAEQARANLDRARQQRQRDLDSLQNQINTEQAKLPILNSQLAAVERELNDLRQQDQAQRQQLEARIAQLSAEINRLEDGVRDYDRRIGEIDSQGGCKSAECQIVYDNFMRERARLLEQVTQKDVERSGVKDQLARLEGNKQRIAQLERDRQQNIDAINWVNGQVRNLQAQLDNLRRQPLQEEVDLANAERELQQLRPEEQRLRADADRIRRDLDSAQRAADEVNRRLRDLQAQRDSRRNRIADLERRLDDLRRQQPLPVERIVLAGDRLDRPYADDLARDGVRMVNLDVRDVDSRDLDAALDSAAYLLADSLARPISSSAVRSLESFVARGGVLMVVGDISRITGGSRTLLDNLLGASAGPTKSATELRGRGGLSSLSLRLPRAVTITTVLKLSGRGVSDALTDQAGNLIGTERIETSSRLAGHALTLGLDLRALPSMTLGDVETAFCRGLSDSRERQQRRICSPSSFSIGIH